MSTPVVSVFLLFSIFIVAYLCWRQWSVLKSLNARAKQQSEEYEKAENARYAELKESARTLALCVVQDQLDLSEGCWRLKLHLDHLWPNEADAGDYKVFYEMFEEIKGFDTHEARANLTAQARFDQDKKRLAIEDRYREQLLVASQKLLDQLQAPSH